MQVKALDGALHPILSCYVLNAAGPWAGELARLAQIGIGPELLSVPLPIVPRYTNLLVFCNYDPFFKGSLIKLYKGIIFTNLKRNLNVKL